MSQVVQQKQTKYKNIPMKCDIEITSHIKAWLLKPAEYVIYEIHILNSESTLLLQMFVRQSVSYV